MNYNKANLLFLLFCFSAARLTAAPAPPTLVYPGSNMVDVVASPILKAGVSAPGSNPLTVTFFGRTAPPGPDFTLAVLPDTQYYTAEERNGVLAMFTTQTGWIVTNRTAHNIAYVAHLGDLVNHGDNNAGPSNLTEWRNATNALYRLENPATTQLSNGIPYGVAVGNHDQSPNGIPTGTTTYYNRYFGVNHFQGRSYYGGHYDTNNDNHFDLFSAGGLEFIVVYLEYDPGANPNVLNWANGLLQTYANRRAIVVSHSIGSPATPSTFSAQGSLIYTALRTNANFFLMLCGHVDGEGSRQDTFDGRTVYTLVSDYQFWPNGGDGWMRLMEFSPSNNVIRVSTYTPWLNQYATDANSQFTLPYMMASAGIGFSALGTNSNVPSGTETGLLWPSLAPGATYEWYVTISDGLVTTTGPVWRFTMSSDALPGHTNTLALWDFNFPRTGATGDTNALTGTFVPYAGSGSLTNIGGTTNAFGNPPAGSTYTSDPWTIDNSALRLGQFPASTSGNKTAGIQFFASTAGYENIKVTWDQENSNTASKYWRVQYTTDGAIWIDHAVITASYLATVTTSPDWQKRLSADFGTVPGVKNNPNFGFRLVSEFQSTATGSGADAYVANSPTNSYGVTGTLWVDMVTLSGTVIDSNTAPVISVIADQNIRANQGLGPIPFTIGDGETAAGALAVGAGSSDPGLIRQMVFGGSGSNRTLSLTPEPNQYGSATITVTVTDPGGKWALSPFNVMVRQPSLLLSNQTLRANTSKTAAVSITDFQSFLGPVTFSVDSSNPDLLPASNVVFGGTGTNRTMSLIPLENRLGYSVLTVTASGGTLSTASSLFLKVVSTNTIGLWDFNSKLRDYNEDTGDGSPAFGPGTAFPCGTATATLNTHISADSFDPDLADNTKWRFANFPAQGTSNKSSGAEFHLSTAGYRDIALSWDHYNSATGSKYWRLQYSLDGVNFTDTSFVYTNPVETTFFATGFSFAGIPGANNRPSFAARLVSEFENTATGQGSNQYIATKAGSTYGTGGTLWLDSVTFTGTPVPPPPNLEIVRSGNTVQLAWLINVAVPALQATPSLNLPAWESVSETPALIGNRFVLTLTNTTGTRFFRLVQ